MLWCVRYLSLFPLNKRSKLYWMRCDLSNKLLPTAKVLLFQYSDCNWLIWNSNYNGIIPYCGWHTLFAVYMICCTAHWLIPPKCKRSDPDSFITSSDSVVMLDFGFCPFSINADCVNWLPQSIYFCCFNQIMDNQLCYEFITLRTIHSLIPWFYSFCALYIDW